MAKKNYGVNDIARWNFNEPEIPAEWRVHLGDLSTPFRMYVDGEGGDGKTEYMMMFSKMSSVYIGKSLYNNVEQGKHKSIQQSHERNNFKEEVKPGKWMYCSIRNYDEFVAHLRKRNSGKLVIIDSISFFPLNAKQIQELFELFPNKSFVLVAYGADATKNKAIKHLCDIKVNVKDFIAYPKSRFDGNEPFVISKKMHNRALLKKRSKQGSPQSPTLFQ